MRRVLFVIDSLQSGGAEKSLVSLLNLLDYSKFQVDLLLFSNKGLYLPLLPKEVRVLESPAFLNSQSRGMKALLKTRNVKELVVRLGASAALRSPWHSRRLHRAQITWSWFSMTIAPLPDHYDIAIAYSQGMPTYFVAEKVTADRKLSWVNTDYRMAKYNKGFDRTYYRKFHRIVTVSDAGREVFTEEFPELRDTTDVVYDIVSPKLIQAMAQEGASFADDFDGFKILTIGRLVPLKGYDMAIEACRMLKDDGFEVRWYAIGEGELRKELEEKVKQYGLTDDFVFLGTFRNPYSFLNHADIYVQPSRFEGFGLAIAEARILRRPIVSTNFPAAYGQLRDGETGLIVNMNARDLYRGIKRMIESQELRQRISANLKHDKVGTEEELHKVYSLLESC